MLKRLVSLRKVDVRDDDDKKETKIFAGACGADAKCDPWGTPLAPRCQDIFTAICDGEEERALINFYTCYNAGRLHPTSKAARFLQNAALIKIMICAAHFACMRKIMVGLAEYTISTLMPMLNWTGDAQIVENVIATMCKVARRSKPVLEEEYNANEYIGAIKADSERAWEKLGGLRGNKSRSNVRALWDITPTRDKVHVIRFELLRIKEAADFQVPTLLSPETPNIDLIRKNMYTGGVVMNI